ncbi:outer membrane lipoprotein carrier protein LolA [Alphaproteobacteria bacterium]|nr:outer membrane lipoprotein carrier protein LolA [Alphaproteobacteria bacterium]
MVARNPFPFFQKTPCLIRYGASILLYATLFFVIPPALATADHSEGKIITTQPPENSQKKTSTPAAVDAAKDHIRMYFKKMKTLTAQFELQTASGDTKKGILFLSRPGKLKAQISSPAEELILMKGNWLTHHIPLMDETTHVPLDDTPARILLEPDADLLQRLDNALIDLDKTHINLRLTYQTEGLESDLIMRFNKQTHDLVQWDIIDSSNQKTTVSLSNVALNNPINPEEFIFDKAR